MVDVFLKMFEGVVKEFVLGDLWLLFIDIGLVIDEEVCGYILEYIDDMCEI